MALGSENLHQLAKSANLLFKTFISQLSTGFVSKYNNDVHSNLAAGPQIQYGEQTTSLVHVQNHKAIIWFLPSSCSTAPNCTFRLIGPGTLLQTCGA